ncbi:hypothetical protein Q3G72_022922 [Acer saccharum]|nr:hypothetical protein Q3G72_022922 [Acer saccharum]
MPEHLHFEQPEEEVDKKTVSLKNDSKTQLGFFKKLKYSFDDSDEVDDKNLRNVLLGPRKKKKKTQRLKGKKLKESADKNVTDENLKDSVDNGSFLWRLEHDSET